MRAKQFARQILEQGSYEVPIDVVRIAEEHNIRVRKQELEDSVSGMLVINNASATIVVNDAHAPTRQRFTIAHEIAHYLLHRGNATVFVDAIPVFFRDSKSSQGVDVQEQEANLFAAELLMPARALKDKIRQRPVDALDDVSVRRLAAEFGVSVQALSIQLARLKMIS